jgi:hypothetical protein
MAQTPRVCAMHGGNPFAVPFSFSQYDLPQRVEGPCWVKMWMLLSSASPWREMVVVQMEEVGRPWYLLVGSSNGKVEMMAVGID